MELLYKIFSVNTKLRKEFEMKISCLGLTYPKWIVLKTIKLNEGLMASELCELVGMDKATMSELINRMTKEGIIVKKESKNDRRISQLFLSDNTMNMCRSAMELENEFMLNFNERLSKEELEFLEQIITKLNS